MLAWRYLDDPLPDLAYFRENQSVFFYPPSEQWIVFGYGDVASLFHDLRGCLRRSHAAPFANLLSISRDIAT